MIKNFTFKFLSRKFYNLRSLATKCQDIFFSEGSDVKLLRVILKIHAGFSYALHSVPVRYFFAGCCKRPWFASCLANLSKPSDRLELPPEFHGLITRVVGYTDCQRPLQFRPLFHPPKSLQMENTSQLLGKEYPTPSSSLRRPQTISAPRNLHVCDFLFACHLDLLLILSSFSSCPAWKIPPPKLFPEIGFCCLY